MIQKEKSIDYLRGIPAALNTLHYRSPESRLTDILGNAGLHLVFPEFAPVAPHLQNLIVLGHQIDHINDEGANFARPRHDVNVAIFNVLYSNLVRLHYDNPVLLSNVVSFLSQAATVERMSHAWSAPSPVDVRNYRELINAIWVRMIISYGSCLSSGVLDPIGNQKNSSLIYEELLALYEPYIAGFDYASLPGGKRNYVMFKWTMAVQDEFDRLNRSSNVDLSLPTFRDRKENYRRDAIQAGINPLMLACTLLLTRIAITTQHRLNDVKQMHMSMAHTEKLLPDR